MCYSGRCGWEQHNGDCSLPPKVGCQIDIKFNTMEITNINTDEYIRKWASDIRKIKIQELETMIGIDEREMASLLISDEMSPEARKFVEGIYVKDINNLKNKLKILTR